MRFPKRKETFIQKLESWWSYTKTYKIEIPYRDFIEGIKNIFKWRKIVWNDRDWDYRFIMNAIKFKIKNTSKYIQKTQRHLNWKEEVRYMNIAIKLIDKLWGDLSTDEEPYESEYFKYQKSEYNWIPDDKDIINKATTKANQINIAKQIENILNDKDFSLTEPEDVCEVPNDYKGNYQMKIKKISENYDEYFAKNKLMHKKAIIYLKTNKQWNSPKSKQTQAMVISHLKEEKARKLFFKILECKINSWWD